MEINVITLDPDFNFDEVFKRNYNTLLNIKITEVSINHSFMIDNVETNICYPKNLFLVVYRQWQNSNWFPLEGPDSKINYYWSSVEIAKSWMDQMIEKYEDVKIERADALEIARSSNNFYS